MEHIVSFPWEQWLRERVTVLHYTCIACIAYLSLYSKERYLIHALSFL